MKENQKQAFDFAADTTKQLITIATAIITLTVTFSKDILGDAENTPKTFLIWTWAVFICSIIFGIITLMTLTGALQPMKKPVPPIPAANQQVATADEFEHININNGNIRFFSISQVVFFIAAIIMTGIFGYKSLNAQNPIDKHKDTYTIIRQSILNKDTTKKYIDTLYVPKK